MQEGTPVPGDETKGDAGPKTTLTLRVDPNPSPARKARLLEILFGPDGDAEAA